MHSINCNDRFSWKKFLRSTSTCKISKHLIIKLLRFGKIGLYDVAKLMEPFPETLLRGFRALSREVWESFRDCLATNDGSNSCQWDNFGIHLIFSHTSHLSQNYAVILEQYLQVFYLYFLWSTYVKLLVGFE